jgi:DNA-binding SARP family transcriptional activator
LRRDLSRLQQDIGVDIVLANRDLIALKEDAVACDVVTFRRLLAAVAEHGHAQEKQEVSAGLCSGCVHWLEEAVALVGGDFMAGFSLPDSAPFEEWQLFQAERYRSYKNGVWGTDSMTRR